MARYIWIILAVSVAAATWGPDTITAVLDAAVSRERPADPSRRAGRNAAAAATDSHQTSRGGRVRLARDPSGHYRAQVRVNGRMVDMLVDTGASLIALTARDARRMGVYPPADAFVHQTRTANGIARVALVELDEVRVGSIRLRDVRATVHKGRGLSTNLLGMSFLGRLRRVKVEGDVLTLVN